MAGRATESVTIRTAGLELMFEIRECSNNAFNGRQRMTHSGREKIKEACQEESSRTIKILGKLDGFKRTRTEFVRSNLEEAVSSEVGQETFNNLACDGKDAVKIRSTKFQLLRRLR